VQSGLLPAVGASGLASGPHLHFALYRGGVYVNPMTVKLPVSPPLAPSYMREFAQARDQLMGQLASAELDGSPAAMRFASARSASRAN